MNIKKIPASPGIYFFKGSKNQLLYIGKAANLRQRLRTYFAANASNKVKRLRDEAISLKIMPLKSEVEALIKEAEFIKSSRPKYNILLRDDKNYFYVGFTKEKFPRVFVTHQPKKFDDSELLGPYVNGGALKKTLKLLRRIFPYCTCGKPHARICFQSQLGICPGFCCRIGRRVSLKNIKSYGQNIKNVRAALTGKRRALEQTLNSQLRALARQRKFEEAASMRDKLLGLQRIFEHRGVLTTLDAKRPKPALNTLNKLQKLLLMSGFPRRIECYDVSEISGKFPVGAMTVFVNGKAQKSDWRLFRIKRIDVKGDVAHIEEILTRRLKHDEWPMPNLIIIDGGMAQLKAAERVLKNSQMQIQVISIAKGKNRKNERLLWQTGKILPLAKLPRNLWHMIAKIRNETHRFAVSFHRRYRKRTIAPN